MTNALAQMSVEERAEQQRLLLARTQEAYRMQLESAKELQRQRNYAIRRMNELGRENWCLKARLEELEMMARANS